MPDQKNNRNWADSVFSTLTLREKIGQLLVSDVSGIFFHKQSSAMKRLEHLINDLHICGFRLIHSEMYGAAVLLNKLQKMSEVPLLISADIETGLGELIKKPVNKYDGLSDDFPEYTHGGGTEFTCNMGVGATGSGDYAEEIGRIVAMESRAVGIHHNYGPVMDVNINSDNPIINTRAYGSDPAEVSRLGCAYIRGVQKQGMIATAKHFPGHGDTVTDSHVDLPVLKLDKERFQSVELIPFIRAVKEGVKSIMAAHIAFPEIDPSGLPASLSRVFLTEILREKLGYEGLIVTDGMTMKGITKYYSAGEATVKAVLAGNDIVLLPRSADEAAISLFRAVEDGIIPEARIDESVKRILAAKGWLGLDKKRTVDIENLERIVSSEGSCNTAKKISRDSISLIKEGENFPVKDGGKVFLALFSGEENAPDIIEFVRRISKNTEITGIAKFFENDIPEKVANYNEKIMSSDYLISIFVIKHKAFKGTLSLPENFIKISSELNKYKKSGITVSFGDPYIIRNLPDCDTYICSYILNRNSQINTAGVIAGEINPAGKIPVEIN